MRFLVPLSLASLLAPSLQAQGLEGEREEIPGRFVVSLHTETGALDVDALVQEWDLAPVAPSLRIDSARQLLEWQRRGEDDVTHLVLVEYSPAGLDSTAVRQYLGTLPGVDWAAPDTTVRGEVKELVPNDPLYGNQYHHPLMRNDDAWDITLGDASVIMGITDDGVDTDHVDLVNNIWVNPGEIAGNGIDDDGNGYVDDVNGWDFVSNNNDPNPNSTGDDHGTHVAGIAGAETNNGVGVAGTAGGATIMPLQFYSSTQGWSASGIAAAFGYGVDNGARILSTSYNMDGWVGDPVVTAAFDYLYDNGVLHFNSAGNGNAQNPPRIAFHQTFLTASTDAGDVRSSFSNYGSGIDVAAPGSSVYATVLNNGYGTKSGTSMAAPNAAGVAALIWSANPTWTRDQVAAQLTGTAQNIDAQNPSYVGQLGGGRVDSFAALTASLPAPRLTQADGLPADGGVLAGELGTVTLRFDQVLDPAAVNAPGAFRAEYAGADGVFGTGDDQNLAVVQDEYLLAGNQVTMTLPGGITSAGLHRFVADASVLANPFGTALDGNGDGIGGDSWTLTFDACATDAVLVDDESGAGWSVVNQNLQTGAWTATPEAPLGGGLRNDPAEDFDATGLCFLTENAPGNTDVDGGPTRLISPAYDLTGIPDPYIGFARWLNSDGGDVMEVHLSDDDGATWVLAATLTSVASWQTEQVRVIDHIIPTSTVRVRWSVADLGTASITEAGLDAVRVFELDCSGDDLGTVYCTATPNSTGAAAVIGAEGTEFVPFNDFSLTARNLPVGQPGLFYFGPDQIQTPFGEGFRCVGGFTVRLLPTEVSDASGEVLRPVDLSAPPAAGFLIPGASVNFQYWYRDPAGGGSGFNLSPGLNVLFN